MFGRKAKKGAEWLADVAFFEGAEAAELERIAEMAEEVLAEPGAVLMDQGQVGQVCYVIVEGSANVFASGEYLATLHDGDMVGEMSIIDHRPRNARVEAETSMVLCAFDSQRFRQLLEETPVLKERVMSVLNARLKQRGL